jgi:hypothetical protein
LLKKNKGRKRRTQISLKTCQKKKKGVKYRHEKVSKKRKSKKKERKC